jgi:hypothetical protein
MASVKTVYLIVHELFGIISSAKGGVLLVTPNMPPSADGTMPGHTYKIGRFKEGRWLPDQLMQKGSTYSLNGVASGAANSTNTPTNPEYNAHPQGTFSATGTPYCTWTLAAPVQVWQERILCIPSHPVFTGNPEGDAVDKQLVAVGLVHVFEYAPGSGAIQIVDQNGVPVPIDYTPDAVTNCINLHIWAEIEDESGMDDLMANAHSIAATAALVGLFTPPLHMQGQQSLPTDQWYGKQLPMAPSVHYVEMMTLAERFILRGLTQAALISHPNCTFKTCGGGSNIFIDG